jgi:hypothetical protein
MFKGNQEKVPWDNASGLSNWTPTLKCSAVWLWIPLIVLVNDAGSSQIGWNTLAVFWDFLFFSKYRRVHVSLARWQLMEWYMTYVSAWVCRLIGHNPGFWLSFLQDIIPWQDIFTWWGWPVVSCAGGVEQRMKPQPTLSVSVSLSFDRTQSRVMTDILTGHNTLRKHLRLMGLTSCLLCWRCGVEDETSTHTVCECESLSSLSIAYLGSFSEDREDIKNLTLEDIWNFTKKQGSTGLMSDYGAQWAVFRA